MSLILYNYYNGENDNSVGVTLPPHTTSTLSNNFQMNGRLDFNTQAKINWLKIENWIRMRNNALTHNQSTNIRGKTVGDYTCWCKDPVTLRKFKAKLTFNRNYDAKSTAFWNNGTWEQDGSTISIEVQEVV